MKRILIAPVRFYQRFISSAFPPSCRFWADLFKLHDSGYWKHGFKGVLMGFGSFYVAIPGRKQVRTPSPDHFSLKRNQEEKNEAG